MHLGAPSLPEPTTVLFYIKEHLSTSSIINDEDKKIKKIKMWSIGMMHANFDIDI